MNLNERAITKLVGVFTLILGLAVIFFYIKSGYKSFGLYLIPIVFVIVSLSIILKENIARWLNEKRAEKPRRSISQFSFLGFFILPLSIFSIIGFFLLFFAIKLKWDVGLLGWITVSTFAFFPLVLIYSLIFGFPISKKRQKQIEERQNKLFADDKGITIEVPLFDKNCFINWQSIEAISYYNYIINSDFTEHYEGYKLYLNAVPIYTKYEKQFWLNRLFPKDSQSKIIDINNETKGFVEIPKIVEKYLNAKVEIEVKDLMKNTLISSETYIRKNKITTVEKWKPRNGIDEQVIFDKFNRSIDKIRGSYS